MSLFQVQLLLILTCSSYAAFLQCRLHEMYSLRWESWLLRWVPYSGFGLFLYRLYDKLRSFTFSLFACLASRMEHIVRKARSEYRRMMKLVLKLDDGEPAYHCMPWTDVIILCAEYQLSRVQVTNYVLWLRLNRLKLVEITVEIRQCAVSVYTIYWPVGCTANKET